MCEQLGICSFHCHLQFPNLSYSQLPIAESRDMQPESLESVRRAKHPQHPPLSHSHFGDICDIHGLTTGSCSGAYAEACACVWQVKEASQQPQMVFTVRHATVTFQTDGDTWREQKEKKAALMVGILIGVFVLCWIPFFITELINPLCSCDIPPLWKSIFLWLGYSNSFFNPLIYTAFNKNYNNAFRNLFSRQH